MWDWIDRLGGIVFRASVSATVLSSLIVLAMLGCRQPARRIVLARAALLGALVLLPLVGFAPLPRFDLFAALRRVGVLPHPLLSQVPALALPGLHGPWPARVVLGFYVAGVGACVAELAVGYWGLGWLTRNSRAPSPQAQALYDALAFSGRWSRPRLRVATRFQRPVLLGTYRPTILIPPALDAEAPDADATSALRLSLLHELAHAERLDAWFSLLGRLALSFWFFLPPLWWIRRRMHLDHEFLADRHAALSFGAPETYASSLVALAAPGPAHASPRRARASDAPSTGGSVGSPLFQRILMLIACPFRLERRPPAWWGWSLSIIVLLLAPLAACLCLDLGAVAQPARAHAPQTRSFRVARVAIPSQPGGRLGRAPTFELPLRLPEQFDLVLEIWADREALARSRVVGQRLVPPDPPGTSESPLDPETWHLVQLKRGPAGLTLSVDGRTVRTDPNSDPITPRLAVEPAPSRPAWIQNLCITWPD
jgi:beta-lactamase regulating signal transducer with metallopeptidase domain